MVDGTYSVFLSTPLFLLLKLKQNIRMSVVLSPTCSCRSLRWVSSSCIVPAGECSRLLMEDSDRDAPYSTWNKPSSSV